MGNIEKTQLFKELFSVINEWMRLLEEGKNISDTLYRISVKRVAIYGMGNMALHIMKNLEGTDISVLGIIDTEEYDYYGGIKTVQMENAKIDPELIIYTNPVEKREVLEELSDKFNCRVVYLGDVVFDSI